MAEDIIRLVRILEYIGPRLQVERGLQMTAVPLTGERAIGNGVVIRSAMIGSFAEIITQAQTGLVHDVCPDCGEAVRESDNYVIPNKHAVADPKQRQYVHLACYDTRGVRGSFAESVTAALAQGGIGTPPDPAIAADAVENVATAGSGEPTYTNRQGTFRVGDRALYCSDRVVITGIDGTEVLVSGFITTRDDYPLGAPDLLEPDAAEPVVPPSPAPVPAATDDDIPF